MITPCPLNLNPGIMISTHLHFGKQMKVTDNGVLQVKQVEEHAVTQQKKNRSQCRFVSFDVDNRNQNTVSIPRHTRKERREMKDGSMVGYKLRKKHREKKEGRRNGSERARQWERNMLFCKFLHCFN
jgi:hypothetical protein